MTEQKCFQSAGGIVQLSKQDRTAAVVASSSWYNGTK